MVCQRPDKAYRIMEESDKPGFGRVSIAQESNVLSGKSVRTKKEFLKSCDDIDPLGAVLRSTFAILLCIINPLVGSFLH